MPHHDWNESYASGCLPWDTGAPDPVLVEYIGRRGPERGRVLEIGAGTGTNALWLARQGFDVLGVDIAPLAVDQARTRAVEAKVACRFAVLDFLAVDLDAGPFDLVFDRGCFHVFDEASERERFAARVAQNLVPDGVWLSLCGSTEGPSRAFGPPRRSARDLSDAIEPSLALVELRAVSFDGGWAAWSCLSRRRTIPGQPSTRR